MFLCPVSGNLAMAARIVIVLSPARGRRDVISANDATGKRSSKPSIASRGPCRAFAPPSATLAVP